VEDLIAKSLANGGNVNSGTCFQTAVAVVAAAVFVVGAVIWEVAAVVNVAALGSVVYWVAAVGEVLDSDGGEKGSRSSLYNEKLVAEIADAI